MTALDSWLKKATRGLAAESAARVRAEIQEHYQAAQEAAILNGATADDADVAALAALGDAKTVNAQYRHVLMTSREAQALREGNWEARAVCSRPWLKWSALAVPVGALVAAAVLIWTGHAEMARDLAISALGMCPLFLAPFLPVYTPSRGRVFRVVKWVGMTAALLLVFGPNTLKWSWLLLSCLWPIASNEWTRASIRRKLPVAAWPKHLYL
jgi:hypothetical protein